MSLSASLNLSKQVSKPTITNTINITGSGTETPITVPQKRSLTTISDDPTIEPSAPLVNYPTIETTTDQRMHEFHRAYLAMLIDTVRLNRKLIGNMIDISDNVILSKTDLEQLIRILTGSSNVIIEIEPVAKCCTSSASLLWNITKITVDGSDFYITQNPLYNVFCQYHISLTCCLEDPLRNLRLESSF